MPKIAPASVSPVAALAPSDRDVVIRRTRAGDIETNFPRQIVTGSFTDYEIGYVGKGPIDLALNIVHLFLPAPRLLAADPTNARMVCCHGVCSALAFGLRRAFLDDFLLDLSLACGQCVTLAGADIQAWIQSKLENDHA